MEVFKDKSWTLRLNNGDLRARHGCYPDGKRIVPWVFIYPRDSAYCWRCQQRIPEGLVALYKLYQWGKA